MNDFDLDRDLETDLRAELHRTIVPPAAPQYLRERLEKMSEQASVGSSRRPGFRFLTGLGGLALGLGSAALVVVMVAATFVWMGRGDGGTAGSAPTVGPVRAMDPGVTPGPRFPISAVSAGTADATLLDVTADGGVFIYAKNEGLRVSLDSGITWSEARPMPYQAGFYQMDFADASHGWALRITQGAATEIGVYRTSDGGGTWNPASVGSVTPGVGEFANASFHFLDTSHGQVWVSISDGGISGTETCEMSMTDDGGATWSELTPSSCIGSFEPPTWTSNAVGYVIAVGHVIAGDPAADVTTGRGAIHAWVTPDGGRTWKVATLPMDPSEVGFGALTLVTAPGRLRLFVEFTPKSGADWPLRAVAYDSTDNATTWSEAYAVQLPDQLHAVSAIGFDHWIGQMDYSTGATEGRLVETLDGGRTWNLMPGTGFSNVTNMRWWDGQRGVLEIYERAPCQTNGSAAARSGEPQVQQTSSDSCAGRTTVFVTNDGGRTWHQVPF